MNRTIPILVIGHVTRDLIGRAARLGGSAAFVARVLSARQRKVVLVTRAPDDPLLKPLATDPRIQLHRLQSDSFTTFRHHHARGDRRLRLKTRATGIAEADIPAAWRGLPFVFLVPVMGECDPGLLYAFPASEVIVGAQGWLRTVDASGRVKPCEPPEALMTARLLAVTLSEEDHPEAEALARNMARNCRFVALTRGEKAVTIFEQNVENEITTKPVEQVRDTIGAGDIFTALVGLQIIGGHKVRAAAQSAAQGAAHFIAGGLKSLG